MGKLTFCLFNFTKLRKEMNGCNILIASLKYLFSNDLTLELKI